MRNPFKKKQSAFAKQQAEQLKQIQDVIMNTSRDLDPNAVPMTTNNDVNKVIEKHAPTHQEIEMFIKGPKTYMLGLYISEIIKELVGLSFTLILFQLLSWYIFGWNLLLAIYKGSEGFYIFCQILAVFYVLTMWGLSKSTMKLTIDAMDHDPKDQEKIQQTIKEKMTVFTKEFIARKQTILNLAITKYGINGLGFCVAWTIIVFSLQFFF